MTGILPVAQRLELRWEWKGVDILRVSARELPDRPPGIVSDCETTRKPGGESKIVYRRRIGYRRSGPSLRGPARQQTGQAGRPGGGDRGERQRGSGAGEGRAYALEVADGGSGSVEADRRNGFQRSRGEFRPELYSDRLGLMRPQETVSTEVPSVPLSAPRRIPCAHRSDTQLPPPSHESPGPDNR